MTDDRSLPPRPSRAPRRIGPWGWLWRSVAAGLLGVLVIGWLLARFEAHQLYYPMPLRGETPADWNLPYDEVRIPTEDGETIHAWWLPQPVEDAPVLLFLHGNAGSREDRLHNLNGLWRAGIGVLIIDYRGYGGSTGTPSEQGLTLDGIAAFDWLAKKRDGRGIVLFGRSLGSAVAAQVARLRPAKGLILESAFTSAPEVARHLYPVPGIGRLIRSRFDTLGAVRQLDIPLLVIHGTGDRLIPFAMGRELFEASPAADKTFRPVPDGGHNDTYLLPGPAYYEWLQAFL